VFVTGTLTAVAVAGGLAFVLVACLTPVMRRIAIRHRLVDQPRSDRIHAIATPYLGGVAIAGGTAAAAAAAHPSASRPLAILVAGVAVAVIGLLDDLRRVSQSVRLATEALAAAGLVCAGVHLNLLAGAGAVGIAADGAVTVAWIVVITNSFNLLDNSDGAAAAIAFASAPVLAVLALATGQRDAAALLAALTAGCAGFLVHNWAPAQIFMGDAGSLFLGFVISSATVLTCDTGEFSRRPPTAVVAALLLLTFVPIADTCTVLLSRKRAGSRWNQGGTDHLAHRLRAIGLRAPHTAVVLSSGAAVAAALGALAVIGVVPAGRLLAGTVAVGATIVLLAQKVAVRRPVLAVPSPRQDPTAAAPGARQDRASVR
jgi:UDP-GlcNAc:undecaprenyl-phosphate/decaprenyl-phosphate GlcNAc-1-phosphate transferase